MTPLPRTSVGGRATVTVMSRKRKVSPEIVTFAASCLMATDEMADFTNDSPCCCTCESHVPDISHPMTDGGRVIEQRGWVCLAPEFDGVLSGWPAHGLCEMWSKRPRPVPIRRKTR
jgi:hypothetical protein